MAVQDSLSHSEPMTLVSPDLRVRLAANGFRTTETLEKRRVECSDTSVPMSVCVKSGGSGSSTCNALVTGGGITTSCAVSGLFRFEASTSDTLNPACGSCGSGTDRLSIALYRADVV